MCSLTENVKLPACLPNSLPLILKFNTFGVHRASPSRSFLLIDLYVGEVVEINMFFTLKRQFELKDYNFKVDHVITC